MRRLFNFAAPGASRLALLDGKTVKKFQKEQHLLIPASVSAGVHRIAGHVDKPAEPLVPALCFCAPARATDDPLRERLWRQKRDSIWGDLGREC